MIMMRLYPIYCKIFHMDGRFLVVTDMDYTLLLPGKKVSPRNMEAIDDLRKAGGILTIATGRTPFLTGIYTKELGITSPIITSNGASIYDPVGRTEIEINPIDEGITRTFLDYFTKKGCDATGYSPEAVYLLCGSKRGAFIENYNKGLPEDEKAVVRNYDPSLPVPVFDKFLLIDADEETEKFVRDTEGIEVVSSAKGFLDIMSKGVSKGNALLKLADILGISHYRTFALGDSENDLSMIRMAGHGIAMKGSDPDVIASASYVTASCEEDGFAKAVYDYILKNI